MLCPTRRLLATLIGVFLPIKDWNQLKKHPPGEANELPQWQKDILGHRTLLIQQNLGNVMPMEAFIAEMEKEADAEV